MRARDKSTSVKLKICKAQNPRKTKTIFTKRADKLRNFETKCIYEKVEFYPVTKACELYLSEMEDHYDWESRRLMERTSVLTFMLGYEETENTSPIHLEMNRTDHLG